MWKFQQITRLKYVRDYTYFVEYNDGVQGEVDFSGCLELGPVFYPLRNKELFAQAAVEGGAMAWPNGADIAPETLYKWVVLANSENELNLTDRNR